MKKCNNRLTSKTFQHRCYGKVRRNVRAVRYGHNQKNDRGPKESQARATG